MKEINRTINFEGREATSPYRCKYKDKNDFEVLRINISYGSLTRTYEVESKYLREDRDSISFTASKVDNELVIKWSPAEIAQYIKRIQ